MSNAVGKVATVAFKKAVGARLRYRWYCRTYENAGGWDCCTVDAAVKVRLRYMQEFEEFLH